MEKFWYSRAFTLIFIWLVVLRIPREMSTMLSNAFGISVGIVTLINSTFVFSLFRTYGYECTLVMCLALYIIYDFIVSMLPTAKDTALGDMVPALKTLPAATGVKKSSSDNCYRLAVCHDAPVYDNHLFQKGKHAKCLECARKGKAILYQSNKAGCGSGETSNNPQHCYDCHPDAAADESACDTAKLCRDVDRALAMMKDATGVEHGSRRQICRESMGSLCWFECLGSDCKGKLKGFTGDVITDVNDPSGSGRGYPTEKVCKRQTGGSQCVKTKRCAGYVDQFRTCACDTYKASRKMNDPCARFEKACDKSSVAYMEAKAKIAQANIKIKDIVDAQDAQNFVAALDKVVAMIP